MKYILVALVALAVFQAPTDAFLGSLISGVTNLVNGAIDAVNSGISTISSTIDTVTFVGQFLWDNALQPSLQVLQQSKALFNNKF